MAVVRTLSTSLTANTTKFDRGMKRAQTRLQKFKGAVFSLKGALIGLGALGVIRGFTKVANEIDRTAKLSDRIGISTENIIALGHAAKITGGSTEDVAKGMERFAQSIGEANQGLSTPLRALETLGIEADSFLKKDLNTQLLEVADAMKAMDNQQARVAASAQLFGRGGKKLVNLLQGGSEAIKGFTDDAKELGILFSREDAAGVEEFNDAWARIGAVFRGVGQSIVVDLAPALIDLAALLLELIPLGARVSQVFAGTKSIFEFLGQGRPGSPGAKSWEETVRELKAFDREFTAVSQRIETLQNRIASRKFSTPTPDNFQPNITGANSPLPRLFMQTKLARVAPTAGQEAGAFAAIAKDDELRAAIQKNADAASQMGDAFGGAFQEAVMGGNELRGVLQGLLQDIASIGLRKAVTEPLGDAFSGLIKGLGLFGGGSPAATVNAGVVSSTANQTMLYDLAGAPTGLG